MCSQTGAQKLVHPVSRGSPDVPGEQLGPGFHANGFAADSGKTKAVLMGGIKVVTDVKS